MHPWEGLPKGRIYKEEPRIHSRNLGLNTVLKISSSLNSVSLNPRNIPHTRPVGRTNIRNSSWHWDRLNRRWTMILSRLLSSKASSWLIRRPGHETRCPGTLSRDVSRLRGKCPGTSRDFCENFQCTHVYAWLSNVQKVPGLLYCPGTAAVKSRDVPGLFC